MRSVNERREYGDDEVLSSITQDYSTCNAIDTEPNDHPPLIRYVDENYLEEKENHQIEADHKELVEIDKEHFNQKSCVDSSFKKKARIGIVKKEVAQGIMKRAFVKIDSRQLRRLMDPRDDTLLRKRKKVQVFVQIHDDLLCKQADVKEEHDDGVGEMDSSVQILDMAPLVEKGIISPFVSSKRFDTSMMEEESLEGEGHGGRTASDVFREEVLKILGQPFNKEEYRKYREAIKVGSYLDHHQDVKRKLKIFQRKQGKCLTILRGFFYWLQNLTREGAFQPWTDKQCLAVEPPPSSI